MLQLSQQAEISVVIAGFDFSREKKMTQRKPALVKKKKKQLR